MPVVAIQTLENIANKYAIGRDVHVGDTLSELKEESVLRLLQQ